MHSHNCVWLYNNTYKLCITIYMACYTCSCACIYWRPAEMHAFPSPTPASSASALPTPVAARELLQGLCRPVKAARLSVTLDSCTAGFTPQRPSCCSWCKKQPIPPRTTRKAAEVRLLLCSCQEQCTGRAGCIPAAPQHCNQPPQVLTWCVPHMLTLGLALKWVIIGEDG